MHWSIESIIIAVEQASPLSEAVLTDAKQIGIVSGGNVRL